VLGGNGRADHGRGSDDSVSTIESVSGPFAVTFPAETLAVCAPAPGSDDSVSTIESVSEPFAGGERCHLALCYLNRTTMARYIQARVNVVLGGLEISEHAPSSRPLYLGP